MKILYLHQYFNTPAMAGGTRSFEMARRMVAAGHEVHMVTSFRDNPAPVPAGKWFHTVEAGIQVHWLANPYSNAMSYGERIQSFLRYALRSAQKATQLGGDVIFATSTPLTVVIPALVAQWRNRIPMVFEVRDLWPEGPIAVGALRNPVAIALARWLERKAYLHASHVIALSPAMVAGVVATGIAPSRVSLIPNSSDTDLFRIPPEEGRAFLRSHPQLAEGPLVVYAGTLGRLNGVGYLARLAGETLKINPLVRFLVVGEGGEREAIATEAKALGVWEKNFWMTNPMPKEDMPRVLSACTVACSLFIDHPYTEQNSPNKAFDAFAAGRPLAVNHRGWIANLVVETEAGLCLSPTDPSAAARDLAEFLRNPTRVEAACQAAARLANERFNRDRLAQALISKLEETVKGPAHSAVPTRKGIR